MMAAQCAGDCSGDELCVPPDPPPPDPELTETTDAPDTDPTTADTAVGVTEPTDAETGPELPSDAPSSQETCAGDGVDEAGPTTLDGETATSDQPEDLGPDPASDSLADEVLEGTNQDAGATLTGGDDALVEVAVGPDVLQPDRTEDDINEDLHAEGESSDVEPPEGPDGCSGCSASGTAPGTLLWTLTVWFLLLAWSRAGLSGRTTTRWIRVQSVHPRKRRRRRRGDQPATCA